MPRLPKSKHIYLIEFMRAELNGLSLLLWIYVCLPAGDTGNSHILLHLE